MKTPMHRGSASILPDVDVELRFARLAKETTGYTRRIMLRLADEAHKRALAAALTDNVIELQLLPNLPGSAHDILRTYG